jgi:four helix bundle protein
LHLTIARGSLSELETQIILAHELGFFSYQQRNELMDQCLEVKRLINGLAKSLK